MKINDIFLATLVAVIWGVNFTVIKIGLEQIPPVLFSAFRFAVVAIPAVFFIPFPKTSFWNVLGVGIILGVIKFSLLFIAMDIGVSAGLASLLLQAQVLFTIILSFILFRETLTSNQIIGLIIAFLGFSFFFFNQGSNVTLLGLILMILAAFSWALANTIIKKMGDVNLLHFMVWVSLIPPIPLAALSYFMETDTPITLLMSTTMSTWLAILYVGFISTLLAFSIWAKLIKSYTSATVTPFALLIPVAGMLTSSIVLGEQLDLLEMLGAFLVMLGLIFCVLGQRILRLLKSVKQQQ
ncbi:MAG: EamA family transporter [Psychromonas sp.]